MRWWIGWLSLLVAVAGVALLAASRDGAAADPPATCDEAAAVSTPCLLPNLRTIDWGVSVGSPRLEIRQVRNRRQLERHLALDNQVANARLDGGALTRGGLGPLELEPVSEDCDSDGDRRNDRTAYQRLHLDSDANGLYDPAVDTAFVQVAAGCMVFHRQHHHWHFEGLAAYALYDVDAGGNRTGAPVSSSEKVSFCLIDVTPVAPEAGGAIYTTCGRSSVEGISPGWSDIYGANLAGQSLPVPEDGDYCLVSTADPEDRLQETDESDNEASARIRIAGSVVTIRSLGC